MKSLKSNSKEAAGHTQGFIMDPGLLTGYGNFASIREG
jgi:hypothetical protein